MSRKIEEEIKRRAQTNQNATMDNQRSTDESMLPLNDSIMSLPNDLSMDSLKKLDSTMAGDILKVG